ncbi:unnamed protein product [Sphagnum tenellum]
MVTTRLINLRHGGEMFWHRDFSSKMQDVRTLQDQIASETAAQLGFEVPLWQGQTLIERSPVNPTAHELMLRAIPAIYRLDKQGFNESWSLLEKAMELDPTSAACHSWLGHWYHFCVGEGLAPNPTDAIQRADYHARQAIMLDPDDARGYAIAGHIRGFLHKDARGDLGLQEKAISLNPSMALSWCYAGLANVYMGNHDEGVRYAEHAISLSPLDSHLFVFEAALAVALFWSRKLEQAELVARRSHERKPIFSSGLRVLLAILGHLKQSKDIVSLRKKYLELEPKTSVRDLVCAVTHE